MAVFAPKSSKFSHHGAYLTTTAVRFPSTRIFCIGMPNPAVHDEHTAGAANGLHLPVNWIPVTDVVFFASGVPEVHMCFGNNPGPAVFRCELGKHPESSDTDDSTRKRLGNVPLLVQIIRKIGVVCTH